MEQQVQELQHALGTMYSNAEYASKQQANSYLQQFRHSNEAWAISHLILDDNSDQFGIQTKLFASQTLRAKISYSLSQLPPQSVDAMKDSLIKLILVYTTKDVKVIRTQLNIALVSLALQHLTWNDPVNDIISIFENQSQQNSNLTDQYLASLLEFLKILPEECSDINKTPLTDNEFKNRTDTLITKNKIKVFQLLIQLSVIENKQTSAAVLDCLTSWITEIPIFQILTTDSLYQLIFSNLLHEQNFELAIEALMAIVKETKDLENLDLTSNLYQELIKLKPLLFDNFDNFEIVNGLTRLFVEIGESWNAQIIKNPEYYADLVELLLKCCEYKDDLDIIQYTFNFWYMSSKLLTSPTYAEQKQLFAPVFHKLIEIIIEQLKYPTTDLAFESQTTRELFDGDLEAEEKFKEFRYDMGDVLKECCYIVGANESLLIPFSKIQQSVAQQDNVKWQEVEAPLFSMRSMAKEIDPRDDYPILNSTFELLLNLGQSDSAITRFNKLKYATILVFGRYTEYTYYHNTLLKPQLDFILQNLSTLIGRLPSAPLTEPEKELITASANSLMYFCQDCCDLLGPYLQEFRNFYFKIRNNELLDVTSFYEITDGFSYIINAQETESQVYESTKSFIEPTLAELNEFNKNAAQINSIKDDENTMYKTIADKIESITVLLTIFKPRNPDSDTNLIANLVIEIYPVIEQLFANFKQSFKVSERLIKFLRIQIQNHTSYLVPILNPIIQLVSEGYKVTKYGCYLWITGIIIREFNDDYVPNEIKQAVYDFAEIQGGLFLSWLNDYLKGVNIGILLTNDRSSVSYDAIEQERKNIRQKLILIEDKVEDFFRMLDDVVTYFPFKFLSGLSTNDSLAQHSFQIAILALNLDKYDPIVNTLRYLVGVVAWGNEIPPIALYRETPIEIRESICKFLLSSPTTGAPSSSGEDTNALLLFNALFKGLLFHFPVDAQYDAFDLVSKLVNLTLKISGNNGIIVKSWVEYAVNDLPPHTVSDQEKIKLSEQVDRALASKNFRKFKMSLNDFIKYYLRKNKSQF